MKSSENSINFVLIRRAVSLIKLVQFMLRQFSYKCNVNKYNLNILIQLLLCLAAGNWI